MATPKKLEILRKAKGVALERQIRAGLPAITPSELELKETGAFQEAKLDLMRVDQEALSQQRHYLEEMAGELRLKIIPKRGLSILKRETGYEWTNGWTKHKAKAKVNTKEKERKKLEKFVRDSQERRKREWIKQAKKEGLARKRKLEVAKPKLMVPKLKLPKTIIQPAKKRRKRHVERSGLTMRSLRHVNGVKVFAFPDDVWKVRKPRKKRRKK